MSTKKCEHTNTKLKASMQKAGEGDYKDRRLYHHLFVSYGFPLASYHITLMVVKIYSNLPLLLSRSGQILWNKLFYINSNLKISLKSVLTFYNVYAKLDL
jgi:hypothetical protein